MRHEKSIYIQKQSQFNWISLKNIPHYCHTAHKKKKCEIQTHRYGLKYFNFQPKQCRLLINSQQISLSTVLKEMTNEEMTTY